MTGRLRTSSLTRTSTLGDGGPACQKLVEHPSGPVWTDGKQSALLSNQWGNFFFPVLDALMTKYKDHDIRIEKAAD